jgi:hypothetical protein
MRDPIDPKVARNLPLSDPRGVLHPSYDWRIRNGSKVPACECVNGSILSPKKFLKLMSAMMGGPEEVET